MKCKHLIYTAVETDKMRGYQVIAATPGISEGDVNLIEANSVPQRVIPMEFNFKEATLSYKAPSGKLCVSRMTNIGTGFDGRPNTIYAHTILFEPEQYLELKGDLRTLERHFIMDIDRRGAMEELDIEPEQNGPPNPDSRMSLEMYTAAFTSILNSVNIILIVDTEKDEKDLLTSILAVVPPHISAMRTYNTLAMEPEEQSMNLMVVPKKVKRFNEEVLSKTHCIIDMDENSITKRGEATDLERFYAKCLHEKKFDTLNMFSEFLAKHASPDSNMNYIFEYWNAKNLLENASNPRERSDGHFTLALLSQNFSLQTTLKHFEDSITLAQETGDHELFYTRSAKYIGFLCSKGMSDRIPAIFADMCHYLNQNRFGFIVPLFQEAEKNGASRDAIGKPFLSWLETGIVSDSLKFTNDAELHGLLSFALKIAKGGKEHKTAFARVCAKGYEHFKDSDKAKAKDYVKAFEQEMNNLGIKDMVAQYDSISGKYSYLGYPEDNMRVFFSKGDYLSEHEKGEFANWILTDFFSEKLVGQEEQLHTNLIKWFNKMRRNENFIELCLKGYGHFKTRSKPKAREYLLMYSSEVDNMGAHAQITEYDNLATLFNGLGYVTDMGDVLVKKANALLKLRNVDEAMDVMRLCLNTIDPAKRAEITISFSKSLSQYREHDKAFDICLQFFNSRPKLTLTTVLELLNRMETSTTGVELKSEDKIKRYMVILKWANSYKLPERVKQYRALEEKIYESIKYIISFNTNAVSENSEKWFVWFLKKFSDSGLDIPKFLRNMIYDYGRDLAERSAADLADFSNRIAENRDIDEDIVKKLRGMAKKEMKKEEKAERKRGGD